MIVEVFPDLEGAASRAADLILLALTHSGDGSRPPSIALSGGASPRPMFRRLARSAPELRDVEVYQVDERVAPDGHADRNLTGLREDLLDPAAIPDARVHTMPVGAGDLDAAAAAYARSLPARGGRPGFDVVQLGLGEDGHTASLFPGDPALESRDAVVVTATAYAGRRRMTVTLPVLDASATIVFLVAGESKAGAVRRLVGRDPSIPASRVRSEAHVVLDAGAAALL